MGGDADQHVFRARLRVFHEHVEISVFGEDAGVEQLVFGLVARASPVGLYQVRIGILALRILVEVLHVRVRRRAVDVEVVLLHILAVVALAVGEPVQALLQDGITTVPQCQREAQLLLVVAQSAEPVLAPLVRARARMVMREVVPGIAVFAVILADRAPLPLAQVGPPLLPGDLPFARLVQPLLFRHVHDFSAHFFALHSRFPMTAAAFHVHVDVVSTLTLLTLGLLRASHLEALQGMQLGAYILQGLDRCRIERAPCGLGANHSVTPILPARMTKSCGTFIKYSCPGMPLTVNEGHGTGIQLDRAGPVRRRQPGRNQPPPGPWLDIS